MGPKHQTRFLLWLFLRPDFARSMWYVSKPGIGKREAGRAWFKVSPAHTSVGHGLSLQLRLNLANASITAVPHWGCTFGISVFLSFFSLMHIFFCSGRNLICKWWLMLEVSTEYSKSIAICSQTLGISTKLYGLPSHALSKDADPKTLA